MNTDIIVSHFQAHVGVGHATKNLLHDSRLIIAACLVQGCAASGIAALITKFGDVFTGEEFV